MDEGIYPMDELITDELIPKWRASESYHCFRLQQSTPCMCAREESAFEAWASQHGGLKRPNRNAEYAHRSRMHSQWRQSSAYKAWLPSCGHDKEHCIGCDSGPNAPLCCQMVCRSCSAGAYGDRL